MYVVWRFVPANLSVIVHGRRIYSVAQVHHRQALSSTSMACLCHLQEHVADVEGAEQGGLEPGTMALDVASSAFDSLPGQKTANTAMAYEVKVTSRPSELNVLLAATVVWSVGKDGASGFFSSCFFFLLISSPRDFLLFPPFCFSPAIPENTPSLARLVFNGGQTAGEVGRQFGVL